MTNPIHSKTLCAVILALLLFPLLISCENSYPEARVRMISIGLDYKNSTAASDLNGTINDALEMGAALSGLYARRGVNAEITYMLQEGTEVNWQDELYPTENNIMRMITTADMKPSDLFIFYYSGHGQTTDEGETAFLVTAATPENPSYTVLDVDHLYHALDSLPCQSIVILDSCYSGVICDDAYDTPSTGMADIASGFFKTRDYGRVIGLSGSLNTQTSLVSSVQTIEKTFERHGLLTIRILDVLGWEHSDEKTTKTDVNGILTDVHGQLTGGVKGLTMDKLYTRIMEKWSNQNQTPDLTGRLHDIYIIP